MKSQKLTVTLMCAGLAVIFSVGVGFAAYTFTVGPASAAGNVSIQVNPYVYLKGIHPGDGGFYYTDASGKTKQYWFSNETSPIFTLYGQTVDSTGAVTGCTLNNDGLEINSAGNALSTTRDYNSVTVTAISNLITIDGATVSAQKLILPTFFIDERDGTKYYVTRYDPQPDKKAGKKTGNFTLFGFGFSKGKAFRGTIWYDEIFFRENEKGGGRYGRRIARKARHSGSDATYGTARDCVLLVMDSFDDVEFLVCEGSRCSAAELEGFYERFRDVRKVVTDGCREYVSMSRKWRFRHEEWASPLCGTPQYQEAMGPLNDMCSAIKGHMQRYRGVASRYLQGYLDLWAFMRDASRKLYSLRLRQ
jgi:hypothetical protein